MASKTVSKGKPFPVRGVAIFIALIAVSGAALQLSNRVDDPFQQISYASTWMQEGDSLNLSTGSTDSSELSALPSLSDLSASGTDSSALDSSSSLPSLSSLSESTASSAELSTFTLPSLGSDTNADSSSVDTSGLDATLSQGTVPEIDTQGIDVTQIGDVAYDLWFLCAVSATVIVAQQGFKVVIRSFKKQTSKAAA